jgi:drug/metabolite transporter (DMT)-like permease
MPTARTTMTPVEWAMLLALSLLWGGSFFFNGVLVRELPPLTIAFFRVAIAAVTLHAVMRVSGRRFPVERRIRWAFAGMGVLNNIIPFSLIIWGQTQIASGVASILNATTPLFTVIVAHVFTADERLTPLRAAGVVTGFAGVAAMAGIGSDAFEGVPIIAYIACLGAALSYGFASVFGRRFKTLGVQPMAVATGQLTASSLILLPIMLLAERPWTLAMPGLEAVAALAGLATVSTALAYILFFRILAGAGATNISLVTFLIPPSAIVLGILFLGEVLQPRHIAGMALIGLGLLLVDGRLLRRRASEI